MRSILIQTLAIWVTFSNIKSKWYTPLLAINNIIIPLLTVIAGHLILLVTASAFLSSTRVHYIQVLSAVICSAVNEQSVPLMSC